MAVKFFGQFLVEKGLVSRESILAAIDLQEQKNLKLGEMGVSMGYITQADIDRAHNAQFSKDMKLGDLLVEMGILALNQLQEIITRQKETHLYIGEALVLVGALNSEQLQQHLNEFKLDQAPYVSDKIELPAGVANSKTWEMTADLTYKMITRVLDLQFRAEKCQTVNQLGSNFMMAALDFSGDVEARYILSVSAEVQKMVAKAILREESVEGESVEILEDTVMEFINVVCGNVAAKASQMGQVININPPVTIHPPAAGLPVPEGHTALCFPIHVGEGEKMELFLLIRQ
ncbi:MAG: chemotaxis protein CheX [Desulfuromonadales bacterium GWD2_54_10]|nr:MAG: chemotaxis protein CheX [Desulfuromonadales bacterium GWD2_54_10]